MRLWFDTNALWNKASALRSITDLARAKGVTPVASAQVYLEDRRQTRVRLGSKFLAKNFDAGFAQLFEIVDVPFNRATAARWADLLAARYPGRSDWRNACHATLGGRLREAFEELPARLPMTTDWWVALAVEDDAGARVVCDERGGEWNALHEARRVLTWSEAHEWLEGLPSVPS